MSGWMKYVVALAVAGALIGLLVILSDDSVAPLDARRQTPRAAEVPSDRSMGLQPLNSERTYTARPPEIAAPVPAPEVPATPASAATAAAPPPGPTARLVGRVLDGSHRPVESARLVAHLPEGRALLRGADGGPQRPETTSGRDGRFELTFPLPDAADEALDSIARRFGADLSQLVVAHGAYTVHVAELPELRAGDNDVGDLVLAAGASVRGRVVDESGRPVEGATVEAEAASSGSRDPLAQLLRGGIEGQYTRGTSGPDGRFLVASVTPGTARLQVSAEGRRMAFVDDLELSASSIHDVGDVALPRGGAISGHVLALDGAPLAGASVRVMSNQRIVLGHLDDLPREQFSQEWRLRAVTDESGWFELSGLGTGQYTVLASAPGHAGTSTENVATGTRTFATRLQRLGRLEVQLTAGGSGEPVDGARILARARSEQMFVPAEESLRVQEPPTDGSRPGLYVVEGVGPAGAELQILADGFAAAEIEAPGVDDGGVRRLPVTLERESVLAGRVLDDQGRGVAGARVSVSEHRPVDPTAGHGEVRIERRIGGGDEGAVTWKHAECDDDGHFRLRGVPAGSWDVVAAADGHVRSEALVLHVDVGDVQDDLRIVVAAAAVLVGEVVEEDGRPVRAADVLIEPYSAPQADDGGDRVLRGMAMMLDDGDPSGPRRVSTDGSGRFAVRDLPAGRYVVKLTGSAAMSFGGGAGAMIVVDGGAQEIADPRSQADVVLSAGVESFVRLIRPPTARLEGQVLADGRGVPGVTVRLKAAGTFLPFGGRAETTDARGSFHFEDVDPGRYEVSAIVPRAALPETVEVELTAGREGVANLVFDGASISGRVTDESTGAGVGELLVEVIPVRETSGQPRAQARMSFVTAFSGGGGGSSVTMDLGGTKSRVTTDAEGRFEALYLDPGDYTLRVSGGAYAETRSETLTVADGQDRRDVELEVSRGAEVVGRVLAGDTGLPLDGVPVSLRPTGGVGEPQMVMSSAGDYRFAGLAPGSYSVSVLGTGFGGAPLASESVTVEKGEVVTLDLRTTGT